MIKRKTIIFCLVAVLTAGALLAGCSSSNSNHANSKSSSADMLAVERTSSYSGEAESGVKSDSDSGMSDTAALENQTAAGGGMAAVSAGEDGFNQKIIYTANLSMQVDVLADSAVLLRNAIQQSGGYILQFQDTKYDGEIGSTYTIKVPADGFMSFIDRIEQIEHRAFERNIGGKDVSEEYVDLESRLKAKQLVEERLLGMMDQAMKADDLLKFSQQLGTVQEEIERIKGRIRYLDKNIAYSTVELRIYQTNQAIKSSSGKEPALGTRMGEALSGSVEAVWNGLKLLLVFIAGALPVAVVAAIIAAPIIWYLRRRRKLDNQAQSPQLEDQQQP